jgi:hypothetical protein
MSEISNTIPVSQVQVGDYVLYHTGRVGYTYKQRKFLKLKRIKELNNGTRMLCLIEQPNSREREMIVMSKGEITIKV